MSLLYLIIVIIFKSIPEARNRVIGFYISDSKLNYINLRKAIIYILNLDEILETILGAHSENINSPLSKNMF